MKSNIPRFVLPAGALLASAAFAAAVTASPTDAPNLTRVPTANTKSDGFAPASMLSPELTQVVVAQGSTKMENPSGLTSYYGYYNDVTNAAGEPQMLPTPTTATEAQKSEPDKNTYLRLKRGLSGADSRYDYGQNFLFQGHEVGSNGASYITRINLDADAQHRVMLLATKDSTGVPIAGIDGSTWDPFAHRLLFTTENSSAPTYSATLGVPSTVTDISGALGRSGYEGIQDDSNGNLWILDDTSGPAKGTTTAKQPNGFVYRYVPGSPEISSMASFKCCRCATTPGDPITFESQAPLNSPDQLALHTYGKTFTTKWLTIHDTTINGNAPFQSDALAKAAHATPFKRPENGLFRPGVGFTQFFFDETGDTSATSPENPRAGGWDSVFKLTQRDPSADTGRLTVFYNGDRAHAGFDNVAFLSMTS